MNTLPKLLAAALFAGAASAAIAGPGPQFWSRPTASPAAKPAVSTEVAKPTAPPAKSGLTCQRMLVPRIGATKQAPFTVVACTPEMMKNDWRCQLACRK